MEKKKRQYLYCKQCGWGIRMDRFRGRCPKCGCGTVSSEQTKEYNDCPAFVKETTPESKNKLNLVLRQTFN